MQPARTGSGTTAANSPSKPPRKAPAPFSVMPMRPLSVSISAPPSSMTTSRAGISNGPPCPLNSTSSRLPKLTLPSWTDPKRRGRTTVMRPSPGIPHVRRVSTRNSSMVRSGDAGSPTSRSRTICSDGPIDTTSYFAGSPSESSSSDMTVSAMSLRMIQTTPSARIKSAASPSSTQRQRDRRTGCAPVSSTVISGLGGRSCSCAIRSITCAGRAGKAIVCAFYAGRHPSLR